MFNSIIKRFPVNAETKLITMLQSLYSYTTSALAQSPDDMFEITLGVRQDGPESPMLFNFYLDYVMRIFRETNNAKNIQFLCLKYLIPSSATRNNRAITGEHSID